MTTSARFTIRILPRVTLTREEFAASGATNTIALDGVVSGGPFMERSARCMNFDHHDGVIREATMSTCMQVYFAIKGGLMDFFGREPVTILVNDPDQDTAFAIWLLQNYKLFENTQSIPHINRLLALNDRWDVTGGAFPMNLDDALVRQHCWAFRPYSDLRKSGALATATAEMMRDNLDATMERLTKFMMGSAGQVELDTRHEILHRGENYWIVDEIGGNEARYHLWSQGMKAFVSIVARRPDGRTVYSIGRRSRYINFPLPELYPILAVNDLAPWGGSDIIGGSNRAEGSALVWQDIRTLIDYPDMPLIREG